MSWRFRQSFTVIPGLRLNLSKSGLSASIGSAPFTVNVGPHGVTGTASVPGTGLSYQQHISYIPAPVSPNLLPAPTFSLPPDAQPVYSSAAPVRVVHSASTELLTSESLKEVKRLIQTAFKQFEEITHELDEGRSCRDDAEKRFKDWDSGFLFKRLFKSAFATRAEALETETAKVAELEEQQRLSTIATHIELENEQAELYFRLRDEFASLSDCQAIWDIKSFQATDRVRERTTADTRMMRQRVRFGLASCDLIQWDQKVPHLKNAKGGELYLYPGFILYRAAREAFSLIEYHDMKGRGSTVSFQEEEKVPSDSAIIGKTWAKANKDGTRDKRFAENHQIPIARYGSITLKSNHGLWEEFHFSNPTLLNSFLVALNAFTSSFAAVADA